jgi:hypothetical protein
MYNQQWYFIFPFWNILFSLLVAYFLGTKKHIGFGYSFLWGIGFSFIFSWIVTAIATPLKEPYKKNKMDIYSWVLCLFMAVLVISSSLELWKSLQALQISKDEFTYFYADAKRAAWQSVFFIIGSLTTIKYIFDPFVAEEKKDTIPEKEFVPEVPNYEIAEGEAEAEKNKNK